MASNNETIEYILDRLGNRDIFTARKMFGEYALYASGAVVALVCDDQLFVKVLPVSKELANYCELVAPYKGAKDHYLVEEHLLHQIEDLPAILISIAKTRKEKIKEKDNSQKKTSKDKKQKSFMEKTFSERVVELALSIPPGRVTTYGALARAAGGGPLSSQSITGILGKAYQNGAKNVPFHRIVYSDGRIWTSEEYDKKRKALYKKEGIELDEKNKIKDFKEKLLQF